MPMSNVGGAAMKKIMSWEYNGRAISLLRKDDTLELVVDGALTYTYFDWQFELALADWRDAVERAQEGSWLLCV